MKIVVERSTRKDKKLMATIGDTKVHFGAIGFSDFTKNKDPVRRANYISRHKKRRLGFVGHYIIWVLGETSSVEWAYISRKCCKTESEISIDPCKLALRVRVLFSSHDFLGILKIHCVGYPRAQFKMKDAAQYLEKLRAYLQYLEQDETHNDKVLQRVKCEIERIEHRCTKQSH